MAQEISRYQVHSIAESESAIATHHELSLVKISSKTSDIILDR
ncbi:hypothetical protein [Calothrix sp. 336/3]|nr:hypothetical protein [Calothrix sp. 336/3]